MNQFYCGQDVVCIDDKFQNVTIPQGIKEGQTYKLRWVGMYTMYVDGGYLGVRLEGVDRGIDPTYGYDDPPFAARRFRPLVANPMAFLIALANDPNLPVQGDEGPLHPAGPLPDEEKKRERVKEDV